MHAIEIARDAIDLFLEYRDKHGYDELHAKVKTLSDIMDFEQYENKQAHTADRLKPAPD